MGISGEVSQGSPPREVIRLEQWTEIVGTVQGVGEVYVEVEAVKRFKIPRETFSSEQIEKLRKGAEVGIFFMDDGKTKIRETTPVPRDQSTVVHVPTNAPIEF